MLSWLNLPMETAQDAFQTHSPSFEGLSGMAPTPVIRAIYTFPRKSLNTRYVLEKKINNNNLAEILTSMAGLSWPREDGREIKKD